MAKKSTPMSDREYVRSSGTKCPVCRSTQISGEQLEVDAGTAWQPMKCSDCHATWNDTYQLVGYNELETNS